MGGLDLFLAALLLLGVWVALPVRWLPMDLGMTLLAMLLAGAGFGLYRGAEWGERAGRAVAALTLIVGCGLATTLAFTAAGLVGMYGPVGSGGAIILTVSAFLLLPYLVVFPAAQLYFLLPSEPSEADADAEKRAPRTENPEPDAEAKADDTEAADAEAKR